MMNEITKKSIQGKLIKVMDEQSLKPGQVAKFLGLNPIYVSMIRNEGQWNKCPRTAWETVLSWINSGTSMKVYAEKQVEIKKESEKTAETVIPSLEKSNENPNTPEVVKTNNKLVDLLKTERLLLENRIQAIDTLLESY